MALEEFGPYQLLEKIDEGGMAEVFLALENQGSSMQNPVVIKRMLKKDLNSLRVLELFMHEANINMRMDHPNVIKLLDFGSIEDRFYISMEHIEGLNLKQLLRKIKEFKFEPLTIYDSVYIAMKASEGLFHAHNVKDENTNRSINIIHKDVSTDNIMIDLSGKVKVIDFGVSTSNELERLNSEDGKHPYMSPEQALGEELDQRADIFSLGAVLWELLAGRRLYNGSTVEVLKEMAQKAKIVDLNQITPGLPKKLLDIVDKALKKDKQKRFTDMGAFRNELSDFLNKHCPSYKNDNLVALVGLIIEERTKKTSQSNF